MSQAFTQAKRTSQKVRIGIVGPTNSGKTYSSILLAQGIIKAVNPNVTKEELGKKIAIVDTERGRAKFYADRNDLPEETASFMHADLVPPYTPSKYAELVNLASTLVGPDGVVIIDSLSHAWFGEGGVLDTQQTLIKKGQNSFTVWNDLGQQQNKMVTSILSVNSHIIATMRSKMEYVLEKNDKDKAVPRQVGLQPIQRDDLEYEFDVTLMLDKENKASILKDTTFLKTMEDVSGSIGKITEELGEKLYKFLNEGVQASTFIENELEANIQMILKMAKEHQDLKVLKQTAIYPQIKVKDLNLTQSRDTLAQFKKYLQEKESRNG